MAFVSIAHRLSGLLTFFSIPFFLWVLQTSLRSPESFAGIVSCFNNWCTQGIVWFLIVGLVFHLIAGCRHMLMDIHIGASRCGAAFGAWLVFGLSAFFALWFAYWIWG